MMTVLSVTMTRIGAHTNSSALRQKDARGVPGIQASVSDEPIGLSRLESSDLGALGALRARDRATTKRLKCETEEPLRKLSRSRFDRLGRQLELLGELRSLFRVFLPQALEIGLVDEVEVVHAIQGGRSAYDEV